MEPDKSEPNLLELQKKDSHHSEGTEKMEKIESDKNSVDIQSTSSKHETRDEKFEKMDNLSLEKIEKLMNYDKLDKLEKSEPINEKSDKREYNEIIEKKEKQFEPIEEEISLEQIKNSVEIQENIAIKEKTEESKLEDNKENKPNQKTFNILEMPEKTVNIFKASAEKKKMELEIEKKPKQNPKKKLISAEEIDVLNQKKARFSIVKQWDNERSKSLNQQINFVDKLLIRLDQKIRNSNVSWMNVIQFFKERIAQEKEYINFSSKLLKLMKPQNIIDSKNPAKKTSVILKESEGKYNFGFGTFLGQIDEAHYQKAKNLKEFCTFLEKNLINEKLKIELENYDEKINCQKKSIENLKKNLGELNLLTAQKAKSYSKLYSEMINDEDFEVNEKKDLFLQELAFVSSAQKQRKGIKDLLIEVLKFIQIFIQLEKKKQNTLKKVFEEYLSKYISAHGPDAFVDLEKKLELVDEKDIDEIHSIQSFLTKDDAALFNKEFDSLEKFQIFLENEYKGVELSDEYSLIKTKFIALTKSAHNYEISWILFTIDRNLNIIKKDETEEINIDNNVFSMRVDNIQVYQKDPQIIELTQNISGFIFNTKKTLVIKTDEVNVLSEIIQMLNKKA